MIPRRPYQNAEQTDKETLFSSHTDLSGPKDTPLLKESNKKDTDYEVNFLIKKSKNLERNLRKISLM